MKQKKIEFYNAKLTEYRQTKRIMESSKKIRTSFKKEHFNEYLPY